MLLPLEVLNVLDVTSQVAESVTPKANVTSVPQPNGSILFLEPVKVAIILVVSVLTDPEPAALLAEVMLS